MDLFIGGRYFSTEPDVKIAPIKGPVKKLPGKEDLWNPLIGFRASYDLTKRWGNIFKGAIGGLGIGNSV